MSIRDPDNVCTRSWKWTSATLNGIIQDRVASLFRDNLKYDYLGNWEDRVGNMKSNQLTRYRIPRAPPCLFDFDTNLIYFIHILIPSTNHDGNILNTKHSLSFTLLFTISDLFLKTILRLKTTAQEKDE